jgi:hypothetical protein
MKPVLQSIHPEAPMRLLNAVFALFVIPSLAWSQEAGGASNSGPEHKALQKLVGKWSLTVKLDGNESKGVTEFKSVLGGLFVQEEASLSVFGHKMEWIGLYGYNRQKKKLTGVWVDNMGLTTIGDGEPDPAGKTFRYSGEHPGAPSARFRWIITLADDDKLTIEMLEVAADGKETSVMTVHGARAG